MPDIFNLSDFVKEKETSFKDLSHGDLIIHRSLKQWDPFVTFVTPEKDGKGIEQNMRVGC